MAFPTSPTNGQIYGKYKFNSTKTAWEQTGDIVDSGSNANGRWVKYSDGTMDCWSSGIVLGSVVDSGAGSYPGLTGFFDRYYAICTWTYPQAFIIAPVVVANHSSNYHDSFGGVSNPTTVTTTSVGLIAGCGRTQGLTAPENTMTAMAKGRWK